MTNALVELDGSHGEGGGQILRTSLTLSLLTGKPFRLRNVRAGRDKPGLRPQHLMAVRAAAKVGGAQVRGASVGSSDLTFEPGDIASGRYRFDIGTAGSTSLVLQTLYLPLALRGGAPSEVTLIGGTHNEKAPCFHFLDVTWRAYLERMGLRLSLRMMRPGFYPRGGGEVVAHIPPAQALRHQTLRQGAEVTVRGFSAAAGLPYHVIERQRRRAVFRMKQFGIEAELREEKWEGAPGSVLALVVDTDPAPALFVGLGARGKPAEAVADEAADQAVAYLRAAPAAVDAHSADQIVLPLALAEGPSEYTAAEMTQHLLTNVAIIRRFVEREIVCEGHLGAPGVVRVH
jgi:RNA 3'-terminal phosphate cyclase (ATP)